MPSTQKTVLRIYIGDVEDNFTSINHVGINPPNCLFMDPKELDYEMERKGMKIILMLVSL